MQLQMRVRNLSPSFERGKKGLMDGLSVVVGGEGAGGRENGNSKAGSHVHNKHRRSKSATDRNLDALRGGVPQSIQYGYNGSHVELSHLLPGSERTCGGRSPLHKYSISTNTDTESSHRASLEKDIEKLQLRLQQEKCMRTMLERAMGRASSTLSPGHGHFSSQTKDLITEIELLEEEVLNREQQVLSLYRSIFEQCVTRPPSEQSSVMASPAHTKDESRKHPTIISSAFCSSKKFPLGPFHALVCINDSGKRTLPLQSKTRRASLLCGKDDHHVKKTRSNHGKVQEILPAVDKTAIVRTLKDHLYQSPTKLSEEMVKCMAAVYCWLRNSASANTGQDRSPLLSRSSTNVVLPQRGISEERDKSCKSMIEISSISTDKNHFSRASYAINKYRFLVEQLERVSVTHMETDAKIAFWINTYNSLIMHAYLAYGIPHSSLRRVALFQKASYKINGQIVSANAIEQAIFCFHTPRVGRWFEIILATAMRKRFGEEKQLISTRFGLQNSPCLVYFALCTGAFSDPVLRVYTASNVQEELEVAKREFLLANVVVKKSKKVFLPKVLERFAKEASISSDDLINWVAENVDKKLRESIQNFIYRKNSKKAWQVVEWLPYDSKFRYVFSKGLTEKPWWV